ncbi:TadE family protein [Bradyrhizobium brasilense]|uniref:Pilus assembly protein n=1 Tax=Bradyrhizobium brasilense TaxID=1419277 RepID=A0ABY8J7A8_9BRAD|nr:TadE family protein [Bradyrhizobium brasilense]WFU61419.1 pilus assembly protein [Bradyrhizobium brasilense]
MGKLDQRGVAAFEFCVIAFALFTVTFAIIDLARYAITMQSLRALANTSARATTVSDCYVSAALAKTTPACPSDPLTTAQKKSVAPFLYGAGLTPTVSSAVGSSVITVTASLPAFAMVLPIWGTNLNAPSASTKIPF